MRMKTRRITLEGDETVHDLVIWGREGKFPWTASIGYAGCGSHEVEIVWQEPMTPEEEAAYDAAVAEQERRNREARDARERRKGLPIIDEKALGFE